MHLHVVLEEGGGMICCRLFCLENGVDMVNKYCWSKVKRARTIIQKVCDYKLAEKPCYPCGMSGWKSERKGKNYNETISVMGIHGEASID